MSDSLFKNAKQSFVREIPANIPPHEFPPTETTMEDVLAMQALQRFTYQPPVNREEREALIEIIKKGKIKHFITGRPKQ